MLLYFKNQDLTLESSRRFHFIVHFMSYFYALTIIPWYEEKKDTFFEYYILVFMFQTAYFYPFELALKIIIMTTLALVYSLLLLCQLAEQYFEKIQLTPQEQQLEFNKKLNNTFFRRFFVKSLEEFNSHSNRTRFIFFLSSHSFTKGLLNYGGGLLTVSLSIYLIIFS
jgi:hypothetical protein